MLKFWEKRLKRGTMTQTPQIDADLSALRQKIRSHIGKKFSGALAIRMVDSGSCNACEAECNALSNPYYALEHLGISFVASPRHADVILLSGVLTANMYHHVLDAWAQIPEPKWIITLGDCPLMQAPFEKNFAIMGPAEAHLPVTHHIPGCPPDPETILRGLLDFLEKI